MILSSNQSSVDDMAAVARGDGQTRSCSSFLPFDCYCCNCNCFCHPHCCCQCSYHDHNFVVCCPRGDNQTGLSVGLLHSQLSSSQCLIVIVAGATTKKEAVNISSSQDRRRTKFEEKSQLKNIEEQL